MMNCRENREYRVMGERRRPEVEAGGCQIDSCRSGWMDRAISTRRGLCVCSGLMAMAIGW